MGADGINHPSSFLHFTAIPSVSSRTPLRTHVDVLLRRLTICGHTIYLARLPVTHEANNKKNTNIYMSKTMTFNEMEDASDNTEVAVVDSEKGSLVATSPKLNVGVEGLSGEFTTADIKPPRLNVVAKTSALVDDGFLPGSIVFQKVAPLVKVGEPLYVTVMDLAKTFQEDVAWGGDDLPKVFATEAEVIANGGSLDYKSQARYRPKADFRLLVEAPKKLGEEHLDLFPFEFEGVNYSMAALTASKSSFKPAAEPVLQQALYLRGKPLSSIRWSITSTKKEWEGNVYYVPVFSKDSNHEGDVIDFIESIK